MFTTTNHVQHLKIHQAGGEFVPMDQLLNQHDPVKALAQVPEIVDAQVN